MRILLIATYLPPYSGSGNIRLLNYINYLSRLGNKVDVVGVEYPKNSIAYDETLEDVFDDEVNIYRVKPGLFYNLFNRKKAVQTNKEKDTVKQNTTRESLNRFKSKINYFIKTTFLIPDAFVGWIRPAYKVSCQLISKNKYDLIFTIHETPSSHIVGYKLKKKFKDLKWAGYWSDPWNGDSVLRNKNSFIKKTIDEYLELKVVKSVDKLLFTTKSTMEMYINKYKLSESKTEVIYRGYDEELYEKLEKNNKIPNGFENDKLNIVHTGTIYKELRDVKPLYKALKLLKENNFEIFNKLNIIFVGQFTDKEDEMLLRGLECVKIVNYLPFEEAMQYVVNAEVLLLYGNKNSTQVPGKLYEYIGSKSIILTILGCEKDELNEIMKNIDKGPIILNDSEAISSEIINLINTKDKANKWNRRCSQFEWSKVVLDLQNKLIN